jgi:hypothetical protein
MVQYLATTQPTADWVLAHPDYLEAIAGEVPRLARTHTLQDAVLAIGSFRAAMSRRAAVLCIWSTDYMDSTGSENWGVVRLANPYGLEQYPEVFRETLERSLYIINQRLQHRHLNDQYIIRNWGDNMHTCLAGRGSVAWHMSLAYSDAKAQLPNIARMTTLVVGPDRGQGGGSVDEKLRPLIAFLEAERGQVARYIDAADEVIREAPRRPSLDSAAFRQLRDRFTPASARREDTEAPVTELPQLTKGLSEADQFTTLTFTYEHWVAPNSPLKAEQREILQSDAIDRHPLRIIGPAGSGKTLLMQLLAMRLLHRAVVENNSCRVLYLVHNSAMMGFVRERFTALGADGLHQPDQHRTLEVDTLLGYSRRELGVSDIDVIDKDANETKAYQFRTVFEIVNRKLQGQDYAPSEYPLLSQVVGKPDLVSVLAYLIVVEIGITIKGHDLGDNPGKYIESEQPLSRLHGVLTQPERTFVFEVFNEYHQIVFECYNVLDSDDLAITLLARLHTPLWSMKRRTNGVDYLFVDETQLFNENERRIFAYLPKKSSGNLPIALALDEAQELKGGVSAGFGLLGISAIEDEHLRTVYRSTPSILRLAFHIVQRTTDLFGVDFPDFTVNSVSVVPDDHKLARKPVLVRGGTAAAGIGRYVEKRVRALRTKNLRQVCVVVHGERYWSDVETALDESRLPLFKLTRRGEKIESERPLVVLAKPEVVGGQEFDAVVSVGLELGVVPATIREHESLAETLRQQALREMYLVFTRARYQLLIVISVQAQPSPLLTTAISSGLIDVE